VPRVDALESLGTAGDPDLRPSLARDVYGDHYTLDG
jgi:hypothetical protein